MTLKEMISTTSLYLRASPFYPTTTAAFCALTGITATFAYNSFSDGQADFGTVFVGVGALTTLLAIRGVYKIGKTIKAFNKVRETFEEEGCSREYVITYGTTPCNRNFMRVLGDAAGCGQEVRKYLSER